MSPPLTFLTFLDAVPLCPRANEVFTPAEMEARLASLAESVGAADPGPEPVRCWACGTEGPGRFDLPASGWRSRLAGGASLYGPKCKEVYCPECFARWGWPGDAA